MSAPITHIVFAEKVLAASLVGKDRAAFLRGTSFPDIRYLGVIDRGQTHHQDVSAEAMRDAGSFQSGFLFHSFVDLARQRYLAERGLLERIGNSTRAMQASKVVEDELLYGRVGDWDSVVSCFDTTDPEELSFPITEGPIRQWHQLLRDYFRNRPDPASRSRFFEALGFPAEARTDVETLVERMRSDGVLVSALTEFYERFQVPERED